VAKHAYTAAWVPDDDPERPWDDAADLAFDWVLKRARENRLEPLLVSPTQGQWHSGADAVREMAQRYDAVTPRSNRPHGSMKRAVLAYVPGYDCMDLAAMYARDGVLAVVESVSHPLLGWAVEVKATNLVTGQVTPDTRDVDLVKDLDRVSWHGNNGWTAGFGKNMATRVLSDQASRRSLDPAIVLGYMVARGHHGKAIERLRKVLDSLD